MVRLYLFLIEIVFLCILHDERFHNWKCLQFNCIFKRLTSFQTYRNWMFGRNVKINQCVVSTATRIMIQNATNLFWWRFIFTTIHNICGGWLIIIRQKKSSNWCELVPVSIVKLHKGEIFGKKLRTYFETCLSLGIFFSLK